MVIGHSQTWIQALLNKPSTHKTRSHVGKKMRERDKRENEIKRENDIQRENRIKRENEIKLENDI